MGHNIYFIIDIIMLLLGMTALLLKKRKRSKMKALLVINISVIVLCIDLFNTFNDAFFWVLFYFFIIFGNLLLFGVFDSEEEAY
jgi:hypothetical protein